MRDWAAFVRSRLTLGRLTPEREAHIVREFASQLEDFYREALAHGASEEVADAHARAQVRDWNQMAADVLRADRRHARPPFERLHNRIEDLAQPALSAVEGPALSAVEGPALSAVEGPRRGALQMFADLLTDMRYGVRQLLKAPGFTIVAILTLAFGVGATTAIFSVVNGVLLRPLPYPEPERLVQVLEIVPQYGRFAVAPANFLDWRQQNTVFERIAAYAGGNDTYIGSDGPERLPMTAVSHDIFELLRVSPALGRSFRADEDAPKQNNVIVISHGMWQRRFGGDPGVLGRSISLSGAPVTIIGVMPAGFFYPNRQTEFWRPIAFNPADASRGGHYIGVIARLKDGISVDQAGAEMKTIAERLAVQYPKNSANESAETVLLHDMIVGPIRPMLLTLLAAVGVVVLIACANVANLLLVRASVREKEIAIRAAIGAARSRIVLQMLGESLVLALAGGVLGVALAYAAISPLQTLSAGSIPRVADVTIDGAVLAFALGVSMFTGLLFGLAPAWQASRAGVGAVLKEGGRSSTSSGGRWMRSTLLVAEVALSLVLLVGATLLLRSFANVVNIDPGFRAENVLAFQVALPRASYPEEHQQITFFERLLERLKGTPGVEKAGLVQTLPMRGGYVLSFAIQGRPPATPGEEPSANHRVVTPDYFQTLGIPLKRGRSFSERDIEKAPMVAVVDEAFVRRHFPGEDPIGRGVDIGNGTDGFYEIVGVVGDVHHGGLDTTPNPTMYVPYRQDVFSSMWVMVRTQGEPVQMAGAARLAVREVDPSLPAFSMTPLAEVVSDSVAQRRFSMLLLGLFALVALFLAAVGLYGVVAYTVSLRTQEIGLRMAIGAQPADVLRMVLGSGMKLATAGVVLGIAGALAMASLVASMLFGVTPFDPVSYGATATVLLLVAALACYVPARRAMAVDPLVALRQD